MKNKGMVYLATISLLTAAAVTAQEELAAPAKLKLGLELVASGLTNPVLVTAPQGDEHHIFIVEQAGRILVLEDGVLIERPFLDISSKVSFGGERGLLGLALDPNYAANRRFYVDYTDTNGDTVVSAFLRHGKKATRALQRSERIILRVKQPFANHNAGCLAFGPDGYLYIALGDGGSGGDPLGNGQNLKTLLGSLLRIDVSILPYSIPSTNPFVNPVKTGVVAQPEIWAYGLRNPWRFSFDRETGDLYIADVGQSRIEEIDFQPAGSPGGRNYGWNVMEGNQDYAGGNQAGMTKPIYEYTHSDGNCSVTGGYVYRGGIKALRGWYFFADYCSGRIWSFKYMDGAVQQFSERTDDLRTTEGSRLRFISSFGQDASGELYICELENGNVYKIVKK